MNWKEAHKRSNDFVFHFFATPSGRLRSSIITPNANICNSFGVVSLVPNR